MPRLETVIDRLRALTEDEQERLAAEIEALLQEPASMLTIEQWLLVDVELAAAEDGENLSHSAVVMRMRGMFGR